MDMGQTQPVLPPSEPPTVVSPPPTPQPEKRKTPWVLILSIGAAACLLIARGGGFLGYQYISTNSTATAVVLGNTSTAENKATNTQVAKVTGTANAHSTATGVAVATRTARAENTATGVAVKTATADVLLSGAPVPFSWKVVGYDNFDSNGLNWFDFPTKKFDDGSYGYGVEDGVMFIEADTTQPYYFYNRPRKVSPLKDAYVSVEVTLASGDESTGFGLLIRLNEASEDLYMIEFNTRGRYTLLRHQNDYWTFILDSTTTAVNRSGMNVVAARFIGDQITLYLNGAEVASTKDARLTIGTIAPFMELTRYGVNARVEFDNFVVLGP
jgi:hypothetical protein